MIPWFLCAFSIKCCGSLSCIIRSRDAGGWGTVQPSGRTNVPARLKSTEDICPSPASCESEHSSEQDRNPPSLCFASHRSRQSDEILGPSRPDKRFIFRHLLASPQQLVLQAGLSPPAPNAHTDPTAGVCWAVTELLIYTPGQHVTAKHLLRRTFISLSPFAAVPHRAATFCRNGFLVSSARSIFHVSPISSSKLNM